VAHDLNLEARWTSANEITVSWNDVYRLIHRPGAEPLTALGIFLGFVASVWLFVATMDLGRFLVMMAIIVAVFLYLQSAQWTKPNHIVIDGTSLHHDGMVFPLNEISRIEYGPESQWTGRIPSSNRPDKMQIRLWMRDVRNHVISENTWQPQVNHRIHAKIEEALRAGRKEQNENTHSSARASSNEYGMPDY